MKTLLACLLLASLVANAWLLRDSPAVAAPRPASAPPTRAVDGVPAGIPLALFTADTLQELRDALRAAGADEAVVASVLEGILRRQQRDQLAETRSNQARNDWWRKGRVSGWDAPRDPIPERLRELLGDDPLHRIDAESRYAFLSAEKRRKLAQIDLDYRELHAKAQRIVSYAPTDAERKTETLLVDERRKDVLTELTPEERAEYDLRFSMPVLFNERATSMGATETEVRAITPLLVDSEARSRAVPRDNNFTAGLDEVRRDAIARLADTLGYERTLEFLWSGYQPAYPAYQRATQTAQLPADTPLRVMELTIETGREAGRVHDNPALSPEERRTALVAVQERARARLDALIPRTAQRELPPDSLRWLDQLGTGQYSIPMPSLVGSGTNYAFDVRSPPPTRRPEPLLPQRPGGK